MCRPKHVEQLRNTGIINSTTRLHLVGSFYEIQGYCLLQQVVHILTTGPQKVSDLDNERSKWRSDSALTALQHSPAIPRNSTNDVSRIL